MTPSVDELFYLGKDETWGDEGDVAKHINLPSFAGDLFWGGYTRPFNWWSDLQIENQKVTLNHLVCEVKLEVKKGIIQEALIRWKFHHPSQTLHVGNIHHVAILNLM